MTAVFADTFYYLALLNRGDTAHARAVAVSRELRGDQLTTTWVLTEVADALSAVAQRGAFLALLDRLRTNPHVVIAPPTQDLFDRAVDLYAHRADKDWSLTDCVSFVVMRDHGITDALTGDHHFAQAGFSVLLK